MTYALITGQRITLRAIPSRTVAERLAAQSIGARVILDPRSVQR